MAVKILMLKHYWMAVGPGGVADYYMIRSTRRDAISAVVRHFEGDKRWDDIRREGWRIIKIQIVPVEGEKHGRDEQHQSGL